MARHTLAPVIPITPQTPRVKRLASGEFTQRIRFGQNRSKRITLPSSFSPTEAASRFARLTELAEPLTKLPTGDALKFLDHAARAPSDADIDAMLTLARERAAAARRGTPDRPVTFGDVARLWTSGELAKRYPDHVKAKRTADSDQGRLNVLLKTIGPVPLKDFTREHAKQAMAAVPSGRASATRRHYAQLISRVLTLAVWPLEIIAANPLPRGFLPSNASRKAKSFLLPSEDRALVSCADVPFERRLLYGFLARTGCRLGEALGLEWRHVDLARGTVRLDATKTDAPRRWLMREDVARALRWLHEQATPFDTDRVFADVGSHSAELFRADLKTADVARPELFERSEHRQPIRVHDLRSTFVVLAIVEGRSESWIADRTGHRSSSMIRRYDRDARHVADLDIGQLGPLDQLLRLGQGEPDPRQPRGPASPDDRDVQNDSASVAPPGLEPGSLSARDFKSGQNAPPCATLHENGGGLQVEGAGSDPSERLGAGRGAGSGADVRVDAVEAALVRALDAATAAGRWDVVTEVARALEVRRGRDPNGAEDMNVR